MTWRSPKQLQLDVSQGTALEGLNKSKGSTFEMSHPDGWQVGATCWLRILALLPLGPSMGLLPFPQCLAGGRPQHESPQDTSAFYSLTSEVIHLLLCHICRLHGDRVNTDSIWHLPGHESMGAILEISYWVQARGINHFLGIATLRNTGANVFVTFIEMRTPDVSKKPVCKKLLDISNAENF